MINLNENTELNEMIDEMSESEIYELAKLVDILVQKRKERKIIVGNDSSLLN